MIDEHKFKLLLVAAMDRQEDETISQAYNRLYSMIQITNEKEQVAKILEKSFKGFKGQKAKRKYTRRIKVKRKYIRKDKLNISVIEGGNQGIPKFINQDMPAKQLESTGT